MEKTKTWSWRTRTKLPHVTRLHSLVIFKSIFRRLSLCFKTLFNSNAPLKRRLFQITLSRILAVDQQVALLLIVHFEKWLNTDSCKQATRATKLTPKRLWAQSQFLEIVYLAAAMISWRLSDHTCCSFVPYLIKTSMLPVSGAEQLNIYQRKVTSKKL